MADQKDVRRRSMVGAPPTRKMPGSEKPSKRGKPVEEEEPIEVESSSNSDEDDEQTTESQSKEESSPSHKKRKKRRIQLTNYGNKSKKRAERREREKTKAEKKEIPESAESPRKEKEKEVVIEEEVESKPKFDEYKSFQLLCDYLVRKFIQKDPEEFFFHPVLATVAPDYHQVITNPMDFLTMRKKS